MTSVHLTNAYHPTSGGIRTFYDALLDAANRERRRVVLVVPGEAEATIERGEFGRIRTIPAPRAPMFDRRYRVILPHRYLPWTGSALIRVLEDEQPELVEICDKYTLPYLAAMLRKRWHRRVPRPTLVALSCERFDDNMAAYLTRSRAGRAFTRWYLRHIYGPPFDAHIAISKYTAAELRDALRGRPPGFIRLCPMGVDVDRFGPRLRSDATRQSLLRLAGGTAGSALLLYAGRMSPEKNVALLVETLEVLMRKDQRDVRMVAVGDGPLVPWMRGQARRLGGRLTVCATVDRETLASYYASCDAFVHPNPREPFGIGPLEAMASGIPVVLPAAGGVLEYATPTNSWLAAPRPDAFAAGVRSALAGDRLRIEAARRTAHAFAWRRVTRQYFALQDELHLLRSAPAVGWRASGSLAIPPPIGNARRVTHV